jgi:excisionase family DNA binding protein
MTPHEVLDLPVLVPVWPEVAQIFDLGKSKVYAMAAANELPVPVMRIGRAYRVRRADLLDVLGIHEVSA